MKIPSESFISKPKQSPFAYLQFRLCTYNWFHVHNYLIDISIIQLNTETRMVQMKRTQNN